MNYLPLILCLCSCATNQPYTQDFPAFNIKAISMSTTDVNTTCRQGGEVLTDRKKHYPDEIMIPGCLDRINRLMFLRKSEQACVVLHEFCHADNTFSDEQCADQLDSCREFLRK